MTTQPAPNRSAHPVKVNVWFYAPGFIHPEFTTVSVYTPPIVSEVEAAVREKHPDYPDAWVPMENIRW